jgi:hypothetical protein
MIESAVHIHPHTLLFEKGLTDRVPLAERNYQAFPKFFKNNSSDFLGYDLFAMVFYFATRYEEYQPNETDEHQRYRAENSLAYQYECLHTPFLNIAIRQFGDKLKSIFPTIQYGAREFQFLSTIDIDNAFAFAHKGPLRNAAGLVKDLLLLKIPEVRKRVKSNLNESYDPYNTYDLIHRLSKETQTALLYFILIGDYSAFDKNPRYTNKGFQSLIKRLANQYDIGLHPSYESYSKPEKIGIEKKRLEEIIGRKVTAARCHFLRLNNPITYRTFIENGITDDYTMIYASEVGFRTGLCTPFPWFDLEKECATNLMIHTSVVMEGTLRDYNKLSIEAAESLTLAMIDQAHRNGGNFISVFHNDSFAIGQEKWISLYRNLLMNAQKLLTKQVPS